MDLGIRRLVRSRAENRCEYCRLPQSAAPLAAFHVEHIIPRQHGGTDDPGNLALACFHCNLHKGPNLAGLDPATGALTALYNPRTQIWEEHFELRGSLVVGLTACGRVTVSVFAMNAEDIRQLRQEAG